MCRCVVITCSTRSRVVFVLRRQPISLNIRTKSLQYNSELPSMASHRIKIAARLRPPLSGEITDRDIAVHHSSDESIDSVDGSYISVVNPRDASQIFKFA